MVPSYLDVVSAGVLLVWIGLGNYTTSKPANNKQDNITTFESNNIGLLSRCLHKYHCHLAPRKSTAFNTQFPVLTMVLTSTNLAAESRGSSPKRIRSKLMLPTEY